MYKKRFKRFLSILLTAGIVFNTNAVEVLAEENTDDDGLDDYVELYVLGYDPLKKDSDDNGIDDGDEDANQDDISNIEEIKLGSKLLDTDSDNDRLLDGEEIGFGTSPVLEDTDEDGVTDYEEFLISQMNLSYDSISGMYTSITV